MSAAWMVCLYVPAALKRQSGDDGSYHEARRGFTRKQRTFTSSQERGVTL
jgi:hypothetical protein